MPNVLAEPPSADGSTPASAPVALPSRRALLDDAGSGEAGMADAPVSGAGDIPAAADRGASHHHLPVVALPDNAMLAAMMRKLVVQKEHFDQLARDPRLAGLLPMEWLAQGGRGLDIGAFVQAVLPFLPVAERGETTAARLPLAHVLGESGRWSRADVDEPRSLAWFLASDDRARRDAEDVAEALLIGPLGLAWMQAGRSRVGFLRAMDCTTLAARVTLLDYPAAEALALYQVTAQGQPQVWCVHGRRRLRELPAPWLSVPLLTAYGVAAPQAWPSGYPPVEQVAQALAGVRPGRMLPEVDLARVARKVAEAASGEDWLPVSLLQLRTWAPRWGCFLAAFVGLPSLLLLTAAMTLPGVMEAATVAASLGFAAGAIGALAGPWIYARRKHLR